jgi:cell division protein FtsB
VAKLRDQLAECFNLGGSDEGGNGTEWRAVHAVRSVRQLRQDYDEACDEAEKLRERVAELEAQNKLLSDDLEATEAERFRLRAENEALRADAERLADSLGVLESACQRRAELVTPGAYLAQLEVAEMSDALLELDRAREAARAAIDAARAAREKVMIGPAGFMAAPKRAIEHRYCKCCRCRSTHMLADRIDKPSRKFGAGVSDKVCPNCESTTFWEIDRAEHEAAEAKRARKQSARAARER